MSELCHKLSLFGGVPSTQGFLPSPPFSSNSESEVLYCNTNTSSIQNVLMNIPKMPSADSGCFIVNTCPNVTKFWLDYTTMNLFIITREFLRSPPQCPERFLVPHCHIYYCIHPYMGCLEEVRLKKQMSLRKYCLEWDSCVPFQENNTYLSYMGSMSVPT